MDTGKPVEAKSGSSEPKEATLLSDSADLFASAQKAMEDVGCLCHHARTIADALGFLRRAQAEYLILDLAFSVAIPFAGKVIDSNKTVSIIFIATVEEYAVAKSNLPPNFLGVFYKPFNPEELVKVVLNKSLGLYSGRGKSSLKKTPAEISSRILPTASEMKSPVVKTAPSPAPSTEEKTETTTDNPSDPAPEIPAESPAEIPSDEPEHLLIEDLPDNYDELLSHMEKEGAREQKYLDEIEALRNQILVLRVERDATRLTFDKNREILKKREDQIKERDETIRLLRSKLKSTEHRIAEWEGREGHPKDFSSDEQLLSRAHFLFRTSREDFNFEVAAAIIDDLERLLDKRGSKILSDQSRRDGEFALTLHSLNTAIIAMTLAKESGLSNFKSAAWAALLHDVSKMKLSGDDYEKHAVESAEWMNTFPLPSEVLQAIREHHEKIDGSGSPGGLREEEIDMLSRIVAVANAAEHTLSALQFQAPPENISAALNSPPGALDSKLVELFIRLLDKPQ